MWGTPPAQRYPEGTEQSCPGRPSVVDLHLWIQDFPDGGANPCAWSKNQILGKIFAQNCMKMKEIGPRGGVPSAAPLIRHDLKPASLTILSLPQHKIYRVNISFVWVLRRFKYLMHHLNCVKGEKSYWLLALTRRNESRCRVTLIS